MMSRYEWCGQSASWRAMGAESVRRQRSISSHAYAMYFFNFALFFTEVFVAFLIWLLSSRYLRCRQSPVTFAIHRQHSPLFSGDFCAAARRMRLFRSRTNYITRHQRQVWIPRIETLPTRARSALSLYFAVGAVRSIAPSVSVCLSVRIS